MDTHLTKFYIQSHGAWLLKDNSIIVDEINKSVNGEGIFLEDEKKRNWLPRENLLESGRHVIKSAYRLDSRICTFSEKAHKETAALTRVGLNT